MKRGTKIKIVEWVKWFFHTLIPLIAAIWMGGMLFEMFKSISAQNYSYFKDYAQISLTLFGFTLIGGIFEDVKKGSKIVKRLFVLSLIFLFSAISFFCVYSSMYLKLEGPILIIVGYVIAVLLIAAFSGFVYGTLYLFLALFDHLKEFIKNDK